VFVNKGHESGNHFLATLNQIDTAIRFRSKTVLDALVNTVVLVVNVGEFHDGNSCLVLSLVKIFKEFT